MPKAAKIPAGWYSKREMAAILAVTEQTIDQVYRKLAAPDAIRTISRKVYFDARQVIDAWCKKQIDAARPAEAQPVLDALIAGGPDSPALEEMRRYRAAQEKIKLALMERTSIPVHELRPALGHFAGVLRRAGEALQRQYGNDAGSVLNDAVDETVAAWERMLSENQPADVSGAALVTGPCDAAAEAAKLPPVR